MGFSCSEPCFRQFHLSGSNLLVCTSLPRCVYTETLGSGLFFELYSMNFPKGDLITTLASWIADLGVEVPCETTVRRLVPLV